MSKSLEKELIRNVMAKSKPWFAATKKECVSKFKDWKDINHCQRTRILPQQILAFEEEMSKCNTKDSVGYLVATIALWVFEEYRYWKNSGLQNEIGEFDFRSLVNSLAERHQFRIEWGESVKIFSIE
jgi:hypothetical protein